MNIFTWMSQKAASNQRVLIFGLIESCLAAGILACFVQLVKGYLGQHNVIEQCLWASLSFLFLVLMALHLSFNQ